MKKVAFAGEQGVSVIESILVLPLLLFIIIITFDLTRLYLVLIMAQELATHTAKIACSTDPSAAVVAPSNLIKPIPGEAATVTARRDLFWANQLDSNNPKFHGTSYFTEKEMKTFNLGYGFLQQLSSSVAFPIPEAFTPSDLEFRVNCSIYFQFDGTSPPLTETVPERNRIYIVECAVPILSLNLFGGLGPPYRMVKRNAYAYRSGNLV